MTKTWSGQSPARRRLRATMGRSGNGSGIMVRGTAAAGTRGLAPLAVGAGISEEGVAEEVPVGGRMRGREPGVLPSGKGNLSAASEIISAVTCEAPIAPAAASAWLHNKLTSLGMPWEW